MYDSNRQLCPLLYGAIEGAAERYGEEVQIIERTCMRQGALDCRFEIDFFSGSKKSSFETPEQLSRRKAQQQLADLVLTVLPDQDGISLSDLQRMMRQRFADQNQLRPSFLLEAVKHLQHAGLVASTANQPGDDLTNRRYWRAPISGKQ
jgi:hypothetical protein